MFASRLLPLRQPARHVQLRPQRPLPPPTSPIGRRAFHASTPRKEAFETFLYIPHELLVTLHSYMPWYAVLPLTAFIVRGILVTGMGSRARSIQSRYLGTSPLRYALTRKAQFQVLSKGTQEGTRKPYVDAQREATFQARTASSALDKRWDCRLRGQLLWTFAQMPLFICVQETLRKMTRMRAGLLSFVPGFGNENVQHVSTGSSAPSISAWYEPSLSAEGLLWFPDLMLPDPTGTLPYICSALMFTNIYFTNNRPSKSVSEKAFPRALRRLLLGLALFMGPLLQSFPAALVYYWICSTGSVMVWNVWLERKYPSVKAIGACKRPLMSMPSLSKTVRRM
ncbi:hypothetical protein BCR34DRAFT_573078 [Clohesyomyces aquaticus]|uniref:60Kd inner membrane protein-domain-containing protein n=1 Tax=Clohesyomyces aquaticus TaxID=1231657 RepID=A0A1Y1Z0W1_9PLEO|nr:hypothetical protein BCR34DRAFT_573078 [Clohesyomyces aquaticus]